MVCVRKGTCVRHRDSKGRFKKGGSKKKRKSTRKGQKRKTKSTRRAYVGLKRKKKKKAKKKKRKYQAKAWYIPDLI